jgi:hypothetical protein
MWWESVAILQFEEPERAAYRSPLYPQWQPFLRPSGLGCTKTTLLGVETLGVGEWKDEPSSAHHPDEVLDHQGWVPHHPCSP